MKKLSFFLAMAGLLLSGCSHDDFGSEADDLAKQQELARIRENAEKIFGKIDSRQDWNSVTKGTVSVTADADLEGIVKVQILTESPFMNPNARVLSETPAAAGQTVELSFDAPNVYNRLFAACVLQIQVPGSTVLASGELHELFGIKAGDSFINTENGQEWKEPVSEVFNVEKGTSIVDFLKQITLRNLTTQKTIALPEAGEPPFAIIVPLSFQYPLEHIDITRAYPSFKQWAQDMTQGTDWYKTCEEDLVYPDMFDDEE